MSFLPGFAMGFIASSASLTVTLVDFGRVQDVGEINESMTFGTAHANRLLVLMIASEDGGFAQGISATPVTFGGITGAVDVDEEESNNWTAIVSCAVPTGTSGTVFVDFDGVSVDEAHWWLYSVVGASAVPALADTHGAFDDSAATHTATVDCPANGAVLAVISMATTTNTYTWAGVTEDAESTSESDCSGSVASLTFASAQTVNAVATPSVSASASISAAAYG